MGLFSSPKREDKKFRKRLLQDAKNKAWEYHNSEDKKLLFGKAKDIAKLLMSWFGSRYGPNLMGIPQNYWEAIFWNIAGFHDKIKYKSDELEAHDLLRAYIILELYDILMGWVDDDIVSGRDVQKLYAMYYTQIIKAAGTIPVGNLQSVYF